MDEREKDFPAGQAVHMGRLAQRRRVVKRQYVHRCSPGVLQNDSPPRHQGAKWGCAELSRAERDYSAVLNTINVTYLLMRENGKPQSFCRAKLCAAPCQAFCFLVNEIAFKNGPAACIMVLFRGILIAMCRPGQAPRRGPVPR